MKPTLKQEQGIKLLKKLILDRNPVSVLQGVAGSGKSTCMNFLLEELPYKKNEVAFLAFTGAAVQVLKRKGLDAQTLHSFLFTPLIMGRKRGVRLKNAAIYSHLKLLVVDEFSMLTQPMLENLLTFGIPLLLVGDAFQLPPIGSPNLYLDKADVFLDEPMRQALGNPILWAANRVRAGEIVSEGFHGEILFIGNRKEMHSNWYNKQFQFICKSNAARARINALIGGGGLPTKGDRIVFNYNDWQKGITNGTLATIDEARKFRDYYMLDFTPEFGESKKRYAAYYQTEKSWNQNFDLAYAITAHKAQGATFAGAGVVYDETTTNSLHSKKFIYTALTRFTGDNLVGWFR